MKIRDILTEQGVAEEVDTGQYDARKKESSSKKEQDKVFAKHRERMVKLRKEMDDEDKKQGVAESTDQVKKVFKKNGVPVGEVGIDTEASPGNGQYYMKCYKYNIDNSGYDSYEEAMEELKHCLKQGVREGAQR